MLLSPVKGPLRLVQHFGERPDVYSQFGLKGHDGADLTGPTAGVPVPLFAPLEGFVYEVGDQGNKGYGRFLRLRSPADPHGRQKEVVLAHFAKVEVKPGQFVYLGDRLGMMGKSGFADGVHTHLGLRSVVYGVVQSPKNGYAGYVDPEPFMRFWADADLLVRYPNG